MKVPGRAEPTYEGLKDEREEGSPVVPYGAEPTYEGLKAGVASPRPEHRPPVRSLSTRD